MNKNIIILTAIGFSIILIIYLNSELLKYRAEELSYRLDTISKEQNNIKSLGLISRYNLIKKRIAKGGDLEKDYLYESKLLGIQRTMIASGDNNYLVKQKKNRLNIIKDITGLYLKFIRLMIGKDMPEEVYMAYNDPFLDLSYFYIRNRKYREALDVMENIRKGRTNLMGYSRRIILLHSGFCYALLSEYDLAKEFYLRVITYYPGTKESRTAKELLGYLDIIDLKVEAILAKTMPPEIKAEKLYLLSAYRKAKELYNKYLSKIVTDNNIYNRAKFYYARSIEELGEREKAIEIYKDIIKKDYDSKWSKMSNKRLFIIGSFYNGDKALIKIAKVNSKKTGDDKFIERLENLSGKLIKENFKENLIKKKYKKFVMKIEYKRMGWKLTVPNRKKRSTYREKIQNVENFNNIVNNNIKVEKKPGLTKKNMVRIVSKDGFLFDGTIIHEDNKEIVIKSEFGKIPIKKDTIGSIKRY